MNEPTAYTARIVATGLATAAGAILTSVIDSRGTLVGAVLVAMAVSALGQAMRGPLDRLERRVKALGVGRSILIIAVLGFAVGTGAVVAHEVLGAGNLSARLARKLQPPTADAPARATPTESVPADEDAKTDAKTPEKPAARPASEPDKQRPAQPAATQRAAAEPTPSAADRP
jgi:hypothetical protein